MIYRLFTPLTLAALGLALPLLSADAELPDPAAAASIKQTEHVEVKGTLTCNRKGEYWLEGFALDFDGQSFEAALLKATADGKYRRLLTAIKVPQDAQGNGNFLDYGAWNGVSWAGHNNLPSGYWVYAYPYWFIWADQEAKPHLDGVYADYSRLLGRTVHVTGTIKVFKDKMARMHETIEVTRLDAEREFVKKTVRVEIKGKLDSRRVPLHGLEEFKFAPAREDRIGRPFFTEWSIVVDGVEYILDFSAKPELEAVAKELRGKTVVLGGILQKLPLPHYHLETKRLMGPPDYWLTPVIQVDSLKAAPVERIKVDVQGKLRTWELGKAEPIRIFEIEVEGVTHRLVFDNDALRKMALGLNGKHVRLTGTLLNGIVMVTSLEPME